MADQLANVELPDPVEITLKPSSYQPSAADMEEEIDMPGMSLDEIRSTSFRPLTVRHEDSG
ncbi:MAG: hypothetical protein F4Y60_01410 [Boseongicola sp. SB0664_bin_43]|uniref:Uncharacterized protein n=1 Tax=Boseongicola sp. SB0664_bin_43 TaxID=2604844 RepID=A0A6B0XYM8_9RHOB|nr:hypothetical protein [Boseongicola sp. SB0664_bin_43]